MATIVNVTMQSFYDQNTLPSNNQEGFRNAKGTKDALNRISNLLYDKLDRSKPIAVTSI